jgi:hypothetical protein
MAALGMPRRGKVNLGECRLRAVHVGRGEIVWQDRCDAANGSKEPKLSNAAKRSHRNIMPKPAIGPAQ